MQALKVQTCGGSSYDKLGFFSREPTMSQEVVFKLMGRTTGTTVKIRSSIPY